MLDYGMPEDFLEIKVRDATAGYVLRKWSVHCSPRLHRLRCLADRLWLHDPNALYAVENEKLALGYRAPSVLTKR
jgi:hypothetical protein